MLFNSVVFIFVFLPITWLGYYLFLAKRQVNLALSWLVGCSLFFYGWWNPRYVLLIFLSMLGNFILAALMTRGSTWKKAILILGISLNLMVLIYYKYCDFFITGFNNLLHSDFNLQHIVLPLAISFFTFTQIAFLVDAYRNQTQEYNFLHYCLFVSFFPHLIAGPIVHHKQLAPQFALYDKLTVNATHLAVGLTIFAVGLFKKLILADGLAENVNAVYGAAGSIPALFPDFFNAWLGTLSYSLQLYFDFSGYSDMAIGLSLLFGIKLPLNFNSPYKAKNVIDFWKRWHISLSQFLRDYLYIPLGGNRKGKSRRYLNLWLTMLLGGAWHGASLNFVIWGALHGFYLIVNHSWQNFYPSFRKNFFKQAGSFYLKEKLNDVLSIGLTFLAVLIAWVFFRAPDLPAALGILQSMMGLHGVDWTQVSGHAAHQRFLWLFLLFLLIWTIPNSQQVFRNFEPALDSTVILTKSRWNFELTWRHGLLTSGILIIALSHLFSLAPSAFMYFDF